MLMKMKSVTRCLRPCAQGPRGGGRHRLDPAPAIRATTICTRPRAATATAIEKAGAAGELLAHLIDSDGELCDYELNARLVAMSPTELDAIPITIGVAAGAEQGGADLRRAPRPARRRRWCSTKRPPTASSK